jgi:signal transduction histidine kinase
VWLSGRAQELTELIGNLVDNALRYGRAGVVITVSVRQEDGEGVLAVEDNGPGVSAADRARVLEPFFRLPGTSGDGSGLGLAIVKEIADGHGADLVVGDGPGGRGLLVELRFPLGPGGERGAATAS